MPSVRIGNDGGDCIIAGGVAYKKVTSPVQPTSGAITATPTTINITGQTFDYDDTGVGGGSNHRYWTPCEIGISKYVAGNQGAAVGVWVNIYTAPSAGVVRLYGGENHDFFFDVKLNGTIIATHRSGNGFRVAWPVGVMQGDIIDVNAGDWVYSIFLPTTYP